jgi:iron complex transport system substrate-binding protein
MTNQGRPAAIARGNQHAGQLSALLNRRGLLATALVASVPPLVASVTPRLARAAQDAGSTPVAGSAGEWSFTDDAGRTVTLPARPQQVVADMNAASALWDFGIRPVAVAGWTTTTDAAWGNVDRETPNINASAESPVPSAEKLLELGADLFVTIYWGNPENPYEWSFPDPAVYEQISQIVPVIAISGTGSADENTARFAELAESLGADLSAPEIAAAKQEYDEAVAEFEKVAAEKADLTSLFVYMDGEFEYVAYPPMWADLAMYQKLGLNIIEPAVPEGEYWQELSPEQARTYESDVLFQSTRTEAFSPEEVAAHPTYGQLPAVKSGQLIPWNQDFIQSYQGLTAGLQDIITALQDAKDVTP